MSRKLPPLNAVRAFEAAARLKSVSKAADELNVTQGAVSHQVKALEDWAQIDLLKRDGRGIALTEPGERYAAALRPALDQIDLATRRLLASDPRKGWLTVSTMPSFAAKFLVPRLPAFRAGHPEIDVWLSTWWNLSDDPDLSAFTDSDVDLAILYGHGGWNNVTATPILDEELFPVCSPAYLAQHPLPAPAALAQATLLHDEMRQDWRLWLRAAGVEGVDPDRGPGFDDSALLIQAAIAGMGVALGRSALVKADLDAGLLVAPFALKLPAEMSYYLVSRPGTENLPKIKAFRDWLIEAARS
ncbi:MAG: transcriptional regulator GcvA [Alphaproteobacteria bacterium]|nr:transcriptional regulator GcvA [Alphaproteobacteria bacterium]